MRIALCTLLLLLAGRLLLAARLDLSAEEALTLACATPADLDCAPVGWLPGALAQLGTALPLDPELALRVLPTLLAAATFGLLLRASRHPRLLALALLAAPGLGLLGFTATATPLVAALWAASLYTLHRAWYTLAGLCAGAILTSLPLWQPPSLDASLGLIRQLGLASIPAAAWMLASLAFRPRERADLLAFVGAWLATLLALAFAMPELMAIPALSALFSLSRASLRWQSALGLAAGPGLLLSLGLAAHHLQPLVSLDPDPRAAFVGGRILGESVAAWGVPQVWCEEEADAAWIRFYAGLAPHIGAPPADSAGLFVRPWSTGRPNLPRLDGPHAVSAWLDGPRHDQSVLVQRWQVYAFGATP